MRWLTFILCMLLMLTLQSTLAPRVELFGARPDWLLALVVFFALYARISDAAIGGWIIGACADLMTIERPGLMALTYMLIALQVASIREYVFRYRPVTQMWVTLVASLLVQLTWLIYRRCLYDSAEPVLTDLVRHCLLASLYTAAWAPLLHHALLPMSRLFGLGRPRYSYVGLPRLE